MPVVTSTTIRGRDQAGDHGPHRPACETQEGAKTAQDHATELNVIASGGRAKLSDLPAAIGDQEDSEYTPRRRWTQKTKRRNDK